MRVKSYYSQGWLSPLAEHPFGDPNEIAEQGVSTVGTRPEFRVKLAPHHKGVVPKLADLHQIPLRGETAENQTRALQCLSKIIIELEAMAMAFIDHLLPVG